MDHSDISIKQELEAEIIVSRGDTPIIVIDSPTEWAPLPPAHPRNITETKITRAIKVLARKRYFWKQCRRCIKLQMKSYENGRTHNRHCKTHKRYKIKTKKRRIKKIIIKEEPSKIICDITNSIKSENLFVKTEPVHPSYHIESSAVLLEDDAPYILSGVKIDLTCDTLNNNGVIMKISENNNYENDGVNNNTLDVSNKIVETNPLNENFNGAKNDNMQRNSNSTSDKINYGLNKKSEEGFSDFSSKQPTVDQTRNDNNLMRMLFPKFSNEQLQKVSIPSNSVESLIPNASAFQKEQSQEFDENQSDADFLLKLLSEHTILSNILDQLESSNETGIPVDSNERVTESLEKIGDNVTQPVPAGSSNIPVLPNQKQNVIRAEEQGNVSHEASQHVQNKKNKEKENSPKRKKIERIRLTTNQSSEEHFLGHSDQLVNSTQGIPKSLNVVQPTLQNLSERASLCSNIVTNPNVRKENLQLANAYTSLQNKLHNHSQSSDASRGGVHVAGDLLSPRVAQIANFNSPSPQLPEPQNNTMKIYQQSQFSHAQSAVIKHSWELQTYQQSLSNHHNTLYDKNNSLQQHRETGSGQLERFVQQNPYYSINSQTYPNSGNKNVHLVHNQNISHNFQPFPQQSPSNRPDQLVQNKTHFAADSDKSFFYKQTLLQRLKSLSTEERRLFLKQYQSKKVNQGILNQQSNLQSQSTSVQSVKQNQQLPLINQPQRWSQSINNSNFQSYSKEPQYPNHHQPSNRLNSNYLSQYPNTYQQSFNNYVLQQSLPPSTISNNKPNDHRQLTNVQTTQSSKNIPQHNVQLQNSVHQQSNVKQQQYLMNTAPCPQNSSLQQYQQRNRSSQKNISKQPPPYVAGQFTNNIPQQFTKVTKEQSQHQNRTHQLPSQNPPNIPQHIQSNTWLQEHTNNQYQLSRNVVQHPLQWQPYNISQHTPINIPNNSPLPLCPNNLSQRLTNGSNQHLQNSVQQTTNIVETPNPASEQQHRKSLQESSNNLLKQSSNNWLQGVQSKLLSQQPESSDFLQEIIGNPQNLRNLNADYGLNFEDIL